MTPPGNAYEIFAREHISKTWLDDEAALFDVKWFDYRFMSPGEATWRYVQAYETAYRRAFKTNFDARSAEYVRVVNTRTFFCESSTVKSALWRGRMMADLFGVPYDQFLSLAFEERLRFWRQNRMPAPNQLYAESLLPRIYERWQERVEGRIWYSEDEKYLAKNYCGSPHQSAHMEWIKSQTDRRRDGDYLLAAIHTKGYLTDAFLPAARGSHEH